MRTFTTYGAALVLAGLTLGTSLAASAASASTGEENDGPRTTWTVEPAAGDGADDRVSLRHDVDPGSSATDAVEVRNFGPSAATFRIYASDGVVGESGAFDILPPGQESTDAGTWVTFDDVPAASLDSAGAMTLQLEPDSSTVIPVSIAVPEDAVPGDHPAGIVAELVPADEHRVQLTSRVGVRLHLRVSGDLAAQVEAAGVAVDWSPGWNPFASGDLRVSYLLRNTGNVRLGTSAVLEVAGPFGLLPVRTEDTRREILPGEEVQVVADVPLWALFWTRGGITVTPAAVGEDAPEAAVTPSSTEIESVTIPWPQLVALLLIAAALYLRRRRRQHADRAVQARIDSAVAEATAAADPDRAPAQRAEEAAGT
ncbi:hypothetical protein [Ruania zhangjianzhongii]|uniref:COG1470 family protein n=1 Tax=Ruania zhangjianzhongii TaxID=2603206 RepID=UPI0011CA6F75|nr:hypothetical protein [Ruania zhangjianzhongii]